MLTLKNTMKDISLLSPFCRPGSRHSILLNITANKEELGFRATGPVAWAQDLCSWLHRAPYLV